MIPLHDHLRYCRIDGRIETALAAFSLQFAHELRELDDRPAHGAASYLLLAVVSGDAQRIEASVKGFQLRGGQHLGSDTGSCAVLDIDVRAHVQLALVTERMDSVEGGCFHQ